MQKLIENKTFLRRFKSLLDSTERFQRSLSENLIQIAKNIKIDNSFDVPFLAGYSRDAKTIYIDKRIPKFLIYKKKRFNIHQFLILHEVIEKALSKHLGKSFYKLAHEIASRAEYATILGEKISYYYYVSFLQEKLVEIRQEHNYCLPHDLDLKPYRDSKNKILLERMKASLKIMWVPAKNTKLKINNKPKIIHKIIKAQNNFPNNQNLPLLVYKQALLINSSVAEVKKFLRHNGWHNIWVDGMYPYHHYHSNTHEALIIFSGQCLVQVGGPKGIKLPITTGDVIIFPAGVSHKKIEASKDFKSIGCYPFRIDYNMNIGIIKGHVEDIKKVKLPKTDPIFGKKGPILSYWREGRFF